MLRYLVIALIVIALMVVEVFSKHVPRKARRIRATPDKITVYKNGKIYTVDKKLKDWSSEPKDCMVVKGETIVFIGKYADAKDEYINSENKVVDLQGRTVLPGFHDVHMHPLEAMNGAAGTCQLYSELYPEDAIDIVKKCAPEQIGTEWVLGFGHSIGQLLDFINKGGRDPRKILDDALPHTPCVMMEETSHSVWVNSEALRRAGYTKDSPNPTGGIIMRNPTTGEPNGVLLENAGNLIMDLALNETDEMDVINYEGLLDAMDMISSHGITSICDARVYWKRGHHRAWKKACANDTLTVRAVLGLWAYPAENDTTQIAALKELYSAYETNCFMKIAQIKFYSDGLLESTTAALLAKYNLNLHLKGLEANVGMNYFTESRIKKYLQELQSFDTDKGFDFHVHTIGDRGVHEVLNAFEATRIAGTRHRLTHVEMMSLADVPRFEKLNVIADFQVAGDFTMPDNYLPELTPIIGKKRTETNYLLVKQVADTGAKVVFSSDWDVSSLNPFVGLGHAVDRGAESVTIKKAVEMYTIDAAYVMRNEEVTGSLEIGKAADFVVIDRDILKVDKRKIKDTVVHSTFLAGEPTFSASGMVTSSTIVLFFITLVALITM